MIHWEQLVGAVIGTMLGRLLWDACTAWCRRRRARAAGGDKPKATAECKRTGVRMCPVKGCSMLAPRRYFAED